MAGTKQPTDKSHFILPDLGEGVHEAELIKWRVKPGERVEEHQTLAEMETDKALVEVPSPWAGVIRELKGKEGEIINVGAVLVTYDIGAARSAPPAAQPATTNAKPSTPPVQSAAKRSAAAGDSGAGDDEDQGTVVGSVGGTLTIPDRFARRAPDQSNGSQARGKALATPAVRRIARERGVDINRVPGSGRGGRVTASDVQNFGGSGAGASPLRVAPPVPVSVAPRPAPAKDDQRIPFRGVRRKIAQALHQSIHTAVHFTVVDEADVTPLDQKRREYAAVLGRKISFLPFVMAAVCRALRQHPALNANVDDEKEEIITRAAINLGCAVDTEHGLMVPVVHGADALSIVELGDAVAGLAAGCRDRSIPRERFMGGTFTISNVGSYGGMFATPIINYPEVGILAAGRVKERMLAKGGIFYAGQVLPLSMSCDHRVVDGAEGARFLNTVVKLLEEPDALVGK